jgi:hypothetical protein
MLRKVGKGKMFTKEIRKIKTMDVKPEEASIKKITEDMDGMGLKKTKRKPLKFKL